MQDEFAHTSMSLEAPAISGETIVPDDQADLSYATRGLYVGSAGDISLQTLSGDQIVLASAQAGVIYPIRIRRVNATGTTAAGLIGLR